MISEKTFSTIEYDKINAIISEYAVLENSKMALINARPTEDIESCRLLLDKTEEAYLYKYKYSLPGIYFFDDISEELSRVDKKGCLNNAELLKVLSNLKSARILKDSIFTVSDENIKILPEIAKNLYVNLDFEKEISSKIISIDEISDTASPKLYSIRKEIRDLNAKIRNRLNSFIHGGLNKFLQDAVITMRSGRYVVPVKSEYKSFVKGFIHDQSSSGSTFFIEPAEIMDLNNELKHAIFDEAEEIQRILEDLSEKVSFISNALRYNSEIIIEFDCVYAKAEYAFKTKSTKPILNSNGVINVVNGRHPLISPNKVVPINVSIGKDYNILLISGPNTGGKTVSMKLVGLFTLMAMSGLYIPASDQSELSFFNSVYCDIGDEQSIENNLSTFSSHIKNIIDIVNNVDTNSLVLIDEIGAGTDPEEGSALSLAVINRLIERRCYGIITTHYSRLKEFAVDNPYIENACMEFDSKTLKPLYRLSVGLPGSSNALEIARQLGIEECIVEDATSYLSKESVSFEKILKSAEESRLLYEQKINEVDVILKQKDRELLDIKAEKDKIILEKQKIYQNAKAETKRIVADKLSEAEEIIDELKEILKRANLESKEVFRASELKNRLKNSKYLSYDIDDSPITLTPINESDLIENCKVFVKSLNTYAVIKSIKRSKSEVEVLVGNARVVAKISDLYNAQVQEKKKENKIKINKNTYSSMPLSEINVIGNDSIEALDQVKNFIDQAVVHNLEEIKIIHGVGKGVLLKEIRNYLQKDKNVLEYRKGRYGEGENGVTIVKLR